MTTAWMVCWRRGEPPTAASPEGTALFGRNYDWEACDAMIVRTAPKNGYGSVSTACLDFLGFEGGWEPDSGMADRIMALAAVYVPLDGMNEKGLCVADLMAGDREETHRNTGNPDLMTTLAIRLLLDQAATVEEALAHLEQYDMHSDIGMAHHLSIADANGKSVVVEYIGGSVAVTDTQVATNHNLADEKFGVGSEQSHQRFETLTKLRREAGGIMRADALRDSLKAVAQSNYPHENDREGTQWSIVYDQSACGAGSDVPQPSGVDSAPAPSVQEEQAQEDWRGDAEIAARASAVVDGEQADVRVCVEDEQVLVYRADAEQEPLARADYPVPLENAAEAFSTCGFEDIDQDGSSDLTVNFAFPDGTWASFLWFWRDGEGYVLNEEFSQLPGEGNQ